MNAKTLRTVVVFAALVAAQGCKKDCIRQTDCNTGEVCTLGACTVTVSGPDGATVGAMTPTPPTTATSAPTTPPVDASPDAPHDAH